LYREGREAFAMDRPDPFFDPDVDEVEDSFKAMTAALSNVAWGKTYFAAVGLPGGITDADIELPALIGWV
jgi:hypothetical protein